MIDRDKLETFAVLTEQGSFEKTADVLHITKGAVSQRIKALEELTGCMLIIRDRPARPTQKGQILLRHAKSLRLLEEATLNHLQPQLGLDNLLTFPIAVNADSLHTWFLDVLWATLNTRFVAIEIVREDQDNTLEKLIKGEVMGCISSHPKTANGFIAEPLGLMEYRCMATHEFAARHFPKGLTAQALCRSPNLMFERKDPLMERFVIKRFGFSVERQFIHYLPSSDLLFEGILQAVGYGLVPHLFSKRRGYEKLIDLAPEHPVTTPLYWHHWMGEPEPLALVSRKIVSVARSRLLQTS